MRRLALILAAGLLIAAEPAPAPDEPLARAEQEARAQALFHGIRCVVCQHESIADSPAGIAADMRRLVRERIAGGATDAAVRADLVRLYGDYVLFRPPFRAATLLLWLAPLLIVVAGGSVLFAMSRRTRPGPAPLNASEEARLAERLARPVSDASPPHDDRRTK